MFHVNNIITPQPAHYTIYIYTAIIVGYNSDVVFMYENQSGPDSDEPITEKNNYCDGKAYNTYYNMNK